MKIRKVEGNDNYGDIKRFLSENTFVPEPVSYLSRTHFLDRKLATKVSSG
jgi:hypothetical protein